MSDRTLGALAALGAVVIWGLTFAPSKVALAEMGPFTLASLRFLLALAVVGAVALPQVRQVSFRRLPWSTLALLGLTGIALFFGFQNLSLARTSATDAGLIAGAVPAITAALSAIVLRERVSPIRVAGIATSILGVAAVVLASGASGEPGSLAGNLLMLGAALSWGVYTLVNKSVGGKLPEVLLLAITMAFGSLFLLPLTVAEIASGGFGPVSTAGWFSVVFLGLAGSGASFFCWNAALRRMDASEAAIYINLVPVITVVSAALMLGERIVSAQLLGGALVVLGVYLAGKQS